jgi:hypothetical protein
MNADLDPGEIVRTVVCKGRNDAEVLRIEVMHLTSLTIPHKFVVSWYVRRKVGEVEVWSVDAGWPVALGDDAEEALQSALALVAERRGLAPKEGK